MLKILDLHSSINDKEILKGVNLEVDKGEIHVLMGPNGSGKSTLALSLMGHPKYKVSGRAIIGRKNILELEPEERAKEGLFLAFQYPLEIEGVSLINFLWNSYKFLKEEKNVKIPEFRKKLEENLDFLGLDKKFAERHLNVGFSGGEKKRAEILQMLVLNPEIIILDETDSGLDVDSIKLVGKAINKIKESGKAILIITHYRRIVDYVSPDKVHIMSNGKIIKSGKKDLLDKVDKEGYKWIRDELVEAKVMR